ARQWAQSTFEYRFASYPSGTHDVDPWLHYLTTQAGHVDQGPTCRMTVRPESGSVEITMIPETRRSPDAVMSRNTPMSSATMSASLAPISGAFSSATKDAGESAWSVAITWEPIAASASTRFAHTPQQ